MYFMSEKIPFDHEAECSTDIMIKNKLDPLRMLRTGGKGKIKHHDHGPNNSIGIDADQDYNLLLRESNYNLIQVCIKMILIT